MSEFTGLRDRLFGRLLLAILVSMAASEAVVDLAVYYRMRSTLEADLGQRLLRAASALALNLDTRLVSQFQPGDENLGAYRVLRARLGQQVAASGLGRAYVVDRNLRTLIDSSDDAAVGTVHYQLMPQERQAMQAWTGTPALTPLYADEHGELRLTALVPITTDTASVSALLGVDAAPDYFETLSSLRRQMALLGAASLAVAGLGGFILIQGATRRLQRVRETVARASLGDFTASRDARRADQLGALERDLDGLLESMVARVDYYESLMASVNIALLAVDLEGCVVGANATAVRWLGPEQPLVGRTLADVLASNDELAALGADVLVRLADGFTREVAVTAGGASRTLAVVVSPLVQGGRHTGATLSLSDVTALRALERQAQSQERLASLGTMAAGLLHEVRTPLASVMMHLDLLRPSVGDQEGLDVLAQALDSAERLSRFLVDFQIVAGLRPLRRDWVDLRDALDAVLETTQIPPRIALRQSSDGPAVVHADRDLLEHALRNLLLNAIEASGPGEGWIALDLHRVDDDVLLTVSDSGPGVAPADLERVFEPMFTTKPAGTGLGLTIVTRVVAAHRGTIQVTNGPGGGAVFTVRWPRGEQR